MANARRLFSWPLALALVFFAIPVILFQLYPTSFWATDDYGPLALADALNLAYRLADLRMYPARGLEGHPGVPFYFMSWLALALSGYPLAPNGTRFLDTVVERVGQFQAISVWLTAAMGAAAVYVFVRGARHVAPIGVIAAALAIWLAATPAALLNFVSPSIDSFAIVLNVLFVVVLLRLATDPDVSPGVVALSACVGALAYLNKLSYIYIPLAFAIAGIANLVFRRAGWVRGSRLSFLYAATFFLVVIAVGLLIIGEEGFRNLRLFHKSIFLHAGIYGAGEQAIVSKDTIWRAFAAIPNDRTYAMILALVGGPAIALGGLVTGWKRPQERHVAVLCIGAGAASFLSAAIVMKHYSPPYTAGVAATLPAILIAGYLLAKSWGLGFPAGAGALAAVCILLMAYPTTASLVATLAGRTSASEHAKADLEEIQAYSARTGKAVEFSYRAPFAGYAEGFVVIHASIPRLTEAYLHGRKSTVSSLLQEEAKLDVGAYVIDRTYFPTEETVKAASNVILFANKPVRFRDGDQLIGLRTVFLLIPK